AGIPTLGDRAQLRAGDPRTAHRCSATGGTTTGNPIDRDHFGARRRRSNASCREPGASARATTAHARHRPDRFGRSRVVARRASLDAIDLPPDAWLIGSQGGSLALGGREIFRVLPRDEDAVIAAASGPRAASGALGAAYDDLAGLIAIDAS